MARYLPHQSFVYSMNVATYQHNAQLSRSPKLEDPTGAPKSQFSIPETPKAGKLPFLQ